jgi:hypothetical protein
MFRTKWETYAYRRIPFGLMNEEDTFQRETYITFKGLINHFVLVYLIDVTFYLKKREYHPNHLQQIFEQCRKYGISSNPKKIVFFVLEGILLRHVIFQG